ncbi:MAG: carbohydrate kinase [Gammaproteobacteria bacterium]|nr:carbohydrate kinase [Gammaproteobacteria bacterium]
MAKVPVIFGEVLFDCFEDGSRVLGGAPFNVAWHLQAFGCAPLLVSRVGDDPQGEQVRDTMSGWGMNTSGLQHDAVHPTGKVAVSLNKGQPSYRIVEDQAYDHISSDALPPLAAALVYHGTLGLRGAQSRAALTSLLDSSAAPVFMDVNLRSGWWTRDEVLRLVGNASWVKVNDEELDILVDGSADLSTKAQQLIAAQDLKLLIVTRGAEGAFAIDQHGEKTEVQPVPASHVVDTVGAGDAFASVCILGLLREWPVALILQRATQFASILVGQRGATAQDRSLYEPLLEQWQR